MVEIKQNLVSKDKYNIKCPYEMKAEFIVMHNTYNDAPAQNEIKYMISNDNQVSFHYAIDNIEIVQGIPEDRNTWNAGDGGNGQGNRKGISMEICYSKSGGERFIQAEKNAAEFVAMKLKEKGWGIDRVKKHQDFSNKYCPHRTLDMGWDRFLNMVKAHLGQNEPQSEPQYKYKVGDIVNINGVYTSSTSTNKLKPAVTTGTITKIAIGARNPYLLNNGNIGWVNDDCIISSEIKSTKKTNEQIADEIINKPNFGGWGKGQERKDKLTRAGYDYNAIQKIINNKLK